MRYNQLFSLNRESSFDCIHTAFTSLVTRIFYVYEELVSKTSYTRPRHVTHLHYFAIKIVQVS